MRTTRTESRARFACSKYATILLVLLLSVPFDVAQAAEPVVESITPTPVVTGEQAVINGNNLTASGKARIVIDDKYIVVPAAPAEKAITFSVPFEITAGDHTLVVEAGEAGARQLSKKQPFKVVLGALKITADTRLRDSMPDELVKITAEALPTQPGNLVVVLNDKHRLPVQDADGKSVTFRIPGDLPPGRYSVVVETTTEPRRSGVVPGELRVISKAAPKITAITPVTGYPGNKNRFNFELTGENFGAVAKDNTVLVNSSVLSGRLDDDCNDEKKARARAAEEGFAGPCVFATPDGRMLLVFGYDTRGLHGPAKIQVTAHGQTSNEQQMLFARIPRNQVLPLALVGSLLVTGLLIALLWQGMGRYRIRERTYSPFAMFFLEKSTNTYSLSKFQLFAWTGAAVFGYLYLLIANLLVQWKFAFPDLPDGLPLLLGISAGTTVTAIGITNQTGGKGSGPTQPSMADFITSGGLIAPERFQFFVWTIVGIIGFISLLLLADPAVLNALPKLPENFVTVMGISSAAYLGGKAVRKGGPVIKTFSIKAVTPAGETPPGQTLPKREGNDVTKGPYLTLNLKGENLDKKGVIKLDDKVLRSDQFWIEPRQEPEPPSTASGELDVNLDLGAIDGADQYRLVEGEHDLVLVNSDGQSSSIRYPLDPLKIEKVDPDKIDAASKTVTITGKNFVDGMKAKWKGSGETKEEDSTLTRLSATEVEVSIAIAGKPGSGVLSLESPVKLRARTTIAVQLGVAQIAPNLVGAKQQVQLVLTGSGLDDVKSAKWKDASGKETDAAVSPQSASAVTVTIADTGGPGDATLTLVGKDGPTVTRSVKVQ